MTSQTPSREPLQVLVYSDDVEVREQVVQALGKRPHPDLPDVEYVEVATEPVVIEHMDTGTVDLAILDGEAVRPRDAAIPGTVQPRKLPTFLDDGSIMAPLVRTTKD